MSGLRVLRPPFVVAPPTGTSMRTRLHVTKAEHDMLIEAGDMLASMRARDLKALSDLKARDPQTVTEAQHKAETAARKRELTAGTSSRIAGSIMRANNAQWALSWRNLLRHHRTLAAQIATLTERTAVAAGERVDGVRGYRTEDERRSKLRRLQARRAEMARVQRRVGARRPSICLGGKTRARRRHNLGAARMSRAEWREDWRASRRFLSFAGETGKRGGNDTLCVDPCTGAVSFNLPDALAHLSNVPGRRRLFRFESPVRFDTRHPQWAAWAARAGDDQAVAYDLRYHPEARRGRGAWYLTASWTADPVVVPSLATLQGLPTLAVDLNAGWIAAVVVNPDGNPTGAPLTIEIPQSGSSRRRLGVLRDAVLALVACALAAGCGSLTIEDLDFADARDTGRETMGRGARGKQFRRKVSNIPTALLAAVLASMAPRRGVAVIAVDAAYTSKWGAQHKWRRTLNCSPGHPCTSHHGAAVVVGRRGLGLAARRSSAQQSMRSCSCPDRPPAVGGKAGSTVRPGRGCRARPQRTSPRPPKRQQPSRRCKTGNAQPGNTCQRNTKPFGVAQRSPPATVAGRRAAGA